MAMSRKITVLYPVTDLASDGAQRQLLELVRGLDKERFRPVVMSFSLGGALEKDFREVPGLELVFIERKGRYDLFCLFKVFRLLRKLKVEVVQPFLTPATFFSLVPAFLCRTPVKIVTERLARGNTSTRLSYRIYLRIEDYLSRFADWAVANSQAGVKYLVERGISHSRVMVIYNGINLDRLTADNGHVEQIRRRLGVPPDGKVVGIMARLFPQKNHALFLQAAVEISKRVPETRFAIVGDGPLRGSLEQLCRQLALGSKVVFFGEQRDVGNYLSACDIVVLTSMAEGCSNSLLEAMALERPVAATNVGGNQEVVKQGETGFLVPAGDVKALTEVVIKLIQEPTKARYMGQKAREVVVSQFSLEKMVKDYEALYEKALHQKAGGQRSQKASDS